ncbi:MAG: Crp/Fnr family transcriptional regulator [Phenylobacterium sp.]|uniref:Crp/Fnr family transcriptional regulator n=1 Tax=Phenylobacterium sp. TaxID=1871053 RepID=UPI001A546239|nr:Crp/Fnr family transcriptional regulator [Phenylobacterium sp.]MBL8774219.1 Crp/Fnr family transcriptional regulator [Phenylobacterium sp.]
MTTVLDDSLVNQLRRQPLFAGLPAAALQAVAATAVRRTLEPNHILFLEGDYETSLFVVVSGQVKLCVHALDGREVVLGISGPGHLFGEIALLDEGPRTATAVTVRPTQMLQIEREALMPVLQAHPAAMLQVVTLLCSRLRASNQMLEEIVFHDARTRLARALRRLCDEHGHIEAAGLRLPILPADGTIEAHAGLQRDTVARLMRAWESDRILRIEDAGVLILDLDRLDQAAGRAPRQGAPAATPHPEAYADTRPLR